MVDWFPEKKGEQNNFIQKKLARNQVKEKQGEKLSSVQVTKVFSLVFIFILIFLGAYGFGSVEGKQAARSHSEEADLQAPQINNQREAKLRSGAYGLDLTEAKKGLEITVDVSVEVSEVTEIQDSRLHAKNEETSVPQPVFIVNQNRQPAPIAQKPRLRGHYVEKCTNCKNKELKGHVAKNCPLPCKNCLRILKVETPRCECVCGAGKMRSVSLIRGPSLPFITRYRQLSNSLPPRVEDIESQWIPANFPRSYNVRLQNTLLSGEEIQYCVLMFNPAEFLGEPDIFSSKRCAFELTYPSMDESGKKKMVSTDMFGLVHRLSSKLIQVHVNSTDLLGLVKRSPAGFTEYYFPVHSEMFVRPMSSHGLYKQYAKNMGEKSAKSCIWRLPLDLRCLVPDFDENLYAMNSNEMEPQIISKLPPSQINREELLETARNLTQLFGFNDSQKTAVEIALQENSIGIVQGPPGTGKTRVAACVALAYYLLGGTVLCVAVTNSAVNHLLEVVVEMVQIFHGEDITASMAQFVNKTVRIFADYLESSYSLEHSDLEIKDEQVAEILQMTPLNCRSFHSIIVKLSHPMRIVFTTLHKVSSVHFKNSYHFDVILMDEASYSPLLQFMGCFNTQAPPVKVSRDASGKIYKKNVMICNKPISNLTLFGDQEQGLGIVCKDCPDIEGELAVSAQAIFWTHLPAVQKVQLNVCYRGRLPLFTRQFSLFYADKITCSRDSEPPEERFQLPFPKCHPDARFVIDEVPEGRGKTIDSIREQCVSKNSDNSRSIFNLKEAEEVIRAAKFFLEKGLSPSSIVALSPYKAQVDLIATKLRELSGALRKIKVFTVDEFQGRESDVVLVSLARSDGLGFLRDRFITATGRQSNLRINVGTTRAREVCVLIGHPNVFQSDHLSMSKNESHPECFLSHALMSLHKHLSELKNVYQDIF